MYLIAAAGIPVPFHILPKAGDDLAQFHFHRIAAGKRVPRRQQPLNQKRRLHDVPAIIRIPELKGFPRNAMHPVGPRPVVAGGLVPQKPRHFQQAGGPLLPRDIAAFHPYHDRHCAKSGPPDRTALRERVLLPHQAGHRVSEVPEIFESLPLHHIHQLLVGELRGSGHRRGLGVQQPDLKA